MATSNETSLVAGSSPSPVAVGDGSENSAPAWRRAAAAASSYRSTALVYVLLVAMVIYAATASPYFWTGDNLKSLLQLSIPLGLVAIGQLVVVLAGGIDMSIGMIARLSALCVGVSLQGGTTPVFVGILFGIAVGVAAGLGNGVVVTLTGANPFIVTLGTFGIIEGICLAITSGSTGLMPIEFRQIYTATVGGFPSSVVVMVGVWVLAALFLRYTQLGRHLFAVGGSAAAAQLAGVPVRRVRIGSYAISGLFGSLAGLFLLAQSGVANNVIGVNLEFASIVAVTLGGASLFGGRGGVVGTIGAVLLLTTTLDVFQLLDIDPNYQNVFQGAVILCAIGIYTRRGLRPGATA
jgi:ribose/xylose/arabinose/galactoside ABC-type transport system permease subunit